MTETLDGRLQAARAHLTTIAPPELLSVLAAEQQRLVAADDAVGRIAVGDKLPTATLRNPLGQPKETPIGPAVLVFYRGAWCPYCNVALAAYQNEVLPEALELGAAFVAISPQGADGSLTITDAQALTFPVLTDHESAYARSLGLAFDLDEVVKEAQLELGNDFTIINSGGEWALPKPTVIVIDANQIVRLVDVKPNYTQRTEPAVILEALRSVC